VKNPTHNEKVMCKVKILWVKLGRGSTVESESEVILGGVGVGKNVPVPTPTSV
jgi:hypothetical protein